MLTNLKALVVILAIALSVFALARPYALRYMDAEAYARRRMVWIVLTGAAFTLPSIWLYALLAMPLMYWAAKKDTNPLAFYVMIAFAVPKVSVQIPTIGIGQFLDLNQSRMMSMAILVPLIFRRTPVAGVSDSRAFTVMDWSFVGLGLLQLGLVLPYETTTTIMRRGVIFFLDIFVMFYAFARLRPHTAVLKEVVASFVLATAIMAPLAVFESLRGWILYIGIGPVWGAIEPFTAYIFRGGLLRAQVSTGHSLAYGFIASLGLGLWFYMSEHHRGGMKKAAIYIIMLAGVYVSGSRGAWLTALIIFTVYIALRPNAGKYIAKVLPVLAIGIAIAYVSPLKESVIDKLPIIGNTDQDTVEYRQQIAEVSWRLIKQNPFFGDPFALRYMEELRQGQGIVDIMNGYANVAVFNGGIGFVLFVTPFAIALFRSYLVTRRVAGTDPDTAALGASLIACLVGSLFFIGTAAIDRPVYWLTGMLATYGSLALGQRGQAVQVALARRFQ